VTLRRVGTDTPLEKLHAIKELCRKHYVPRSRDPSPAFGLLNESLVQAIHGSPAYGIWWLEQDAQVVGYLLATVYSNTWVDSPGLYVYIWQVCLAPGASRHEAWDLWRPALQEFARFWRADRVLGVTYRDGPGYRRVLERCGFRPTATLYEWRMDDERGAAS
jgi:hypothetical protein